MSYLGLDIGTSGCKAVVYSSDGLALKSAFREYTLIHPLAAYAELDSAWVINSCYDVIREVNANLTDAVVAMCISSQGEAFTAVGENGHILCNAMVSSDSRAEQEVLSFTSTFGKEKIYQITGHTPHSIFTLFKLLWLKNNRIEIWNEARYFLCFEDLFIYTLGLNPAISWPLAGRTMLFDVKKHQWSSEILNAIGLDENKLAIPVASGQVSAIIPKKIAETLGFQNEVIIVAGGHDQTVGALGAGVTESGECMYATGTVECFCPVFDNLTLESPLMQNNLCCYDYTILGKYATVAYSLTGGNILKWFRDEFGQIEKQKAAQNGTDVYSELLSHMPEEPSKLLTLPYFSPTGTPYFDSFTHGAILGLQLTTSRYEILKSLLEGVALEMRLNLELMEQSGMQVNCFIATGGGARNSAWVQLKADVLNRPVKVTNRNETGCYGAAMIAMSGVEEIDITAIIKRNQGELKVYEPVDKRAAIYTEKFIKYRNLYACIKSFN